jgi:predicted porin
LDYALSKRTVAYIHMGQEEVAAITNGQAVLVGRAKQNDTAFGLRHSF